MIAAGTGGPAQAAPITHVLPVRVYQLCDDNGLNCAPTGPAGNEYFAAETAKIWEQAGIRIDYVSFQQFHSTAFSYLDPAVPGDTLFDLQFAATGVGQSSIYVDLFLAREVQNHFGFAWSGFGGIAVSMDGLVSFAGGLGRRDTIAHEIGHNLGLVPLPIGGDADGHSTVDTHLMAAGQIRQVPFSLNDIAPDGRRLDLLPDNQIAYALQSDLLIPLPESASPWLVAAGMAAILGYRQRLRR